MNGYVAYLQLSSVRGGVKGVRIKIIIDSVVS